MNKCLPFCTALDSPWSHFLREKNVKNSLENSRFLLILEISSFHAPMTWPYVQDSVQFTLVAQSCLTLCEAMDCSTPDLPIHHQLRVYSNSCPLSRWCHPTTSSSIAPSSSCLQSFPASGSFQTSQLFASGSQSIGSFNFSISPSNEHRGLISFGMDWLDLLAVQGTHNIFLQHRSSKASFFGAQLTL